MAIQKYDDPASKEAPSATQYLHTQNVLLTIYVRHNVKDFSQSLTLYIFALNFRKHIIILCALIHPTFFHPPAAAQVEVRV